MTALDEGTVECWVDPLVIHQLTYVLLGLRLFPDRLAVRDSLRDPRHARCTGATPLAAPRRAYSVGCP